MSALTSALAAFAATAPSLPVLVGSAVADDDEVASTSASSPGMLPFRSVYGFVYSTSSQIYLRHLPFLPRRALLRVLLYLPVHVRRLTLIFATNLSCPRRGETST